MYSIFGSFVLDLKNYLKGTFKHSKWQPQNQIKYDGSWVTVSNDVPIWWVCPDPQPQMCVGSCGSDIQTVWVMPGDLLQYLINMREKSVQRKFWRPIWVLWSVHLLICSYTYVGEIPQAFIQL